MVLLKGSVPTGNFAEPRLTSGAFAFLMSTVDDPIRAKPRECGLSRWPLLRKREKWRTPSQLMSASTKTILPTQIGPPALSRQSC